MKPSSSRKTPPAPAAPGALADPQAPAREALAALDADGFARALKKLQREAPRGASNPGSVHCTGCEGCVSCTFCRDCKDCYGSSHCKACTRCSDCRHSVECTDCDACAYCVRCEGCSSSAYLVLCRDLSGCNYCFGCVGLTAKDFHILNVPFPRAEYFRAVARLAKALGLPALPGGARG